MSDLKRIDSLQLVGGIVIAVLAFWVVNTFLFPIFAVVAALFWMIAGLLSGVVQIILFLALIFAAIYGLAHLAGLTK